MKSLGALVSLHARLPSAYCLLFSEESFRRLARQPDDNENSAVGRRSARLPSAYCLLPTVF